jgi:hypothetical protein
LNSSCPGSGIGRRFPWFQPKSGGFAGQIPQNMPQEEEHSPKETFSL